MNYGYDERSQLLREYKRIQKEGRPQPASGPHKTFHCVVAVPQLSKMRRKQFKTNGIRYSGLSFNLVSQVGDHLVYKSNCPRCAAKDAIQADTVFKDGRTLWPPELGYPELCLDCEDKLDELMEPAA